MAEVVKATGKLVDLSDKNANVKDIIIAQMTISRHRIDSMLQSKGPFGPF